MSIRHNVFISYHPKNDEAYKLEFERLFFQVYDILETNAVSDGEINPYIRAENIRQKIIDEFIRSASVTVVLIGSETWKRKHVDWEISSSIGGAELDARKGLIGIILPSYPRPDTNKYSKGTIPPRLQDNIDCGFAKIYNWSEEPYEVQRWIHEAFVRRKQLNPDNAREPFEQNLSTASWC